jgi:hydrogenase maturation protein HypF
MAASLLRVRGVVQGVGFRPHAWRLANELGLAGWVRNDAEGVEIALSGNASSIERFIERLRAEAPPLARIDAIERCAGAPGEGASGEGFAILDSASGEVRTAIGPDAAICTDCLAEVFDPAHRRYRYAFTTCTHCGPRYTIARSLPYDRATTSLAPFPLCSRCAAEYGDPADRRFHAESTCCPDCGPRLSLRAMDGQAMAGDPVADTLRLLQAGRIVAIKGLGGFHLACDARNAAAVATLRERKAREAKPFAVMATSPVVVSGFAAPTRDDLALLRSAAAPVVLLDKRPPCDAALPGVAPGVGALGLMLPNTPLQWLIFHEAAGRPAGTAWIDAAPPDLVLVMTSANPQGEPLVIDDAEALDRLQGIADAVLGHDRAIVARADDSVIRGGEAGVRACEVTTRGGAGGPAFIRRGRGYAPQAIRLPAAGPSTIAFGGWFKNTICVTRGDEAFVSTHVGDLDNAAACGFLDETVERMLALTEIAPERVAHDLHPDFHSTRTALRFAADRGLPAFAVQHHHAHLAAVAAEHGIDEAVFGLALDGVGLGADGTAWGGELLHVDGAGFERIGHLAPLALPGGDRAAREPWRMGAAALWALGRGEEIEHRFASQPGAATIRQMLERGLNCPPTTSVGRLFDAAAGLLGIQPVAAFEAQAAMRLEALADRHGPCAALSEGWTIADGVLDLAPLLAALADETDAGRGAALFHATLAAALADWVAAGLPAGQRRIAGAGGCFLNRRLAGALRAHLAERGIEVLEARRVPPGDGGLSLGQSWVAMRGTPD